MITEEQKDKIDKIMLRAYPSEGVCGINKDGEVIEFKNIADDPRKDFKIDAKVFHKSNIELLIHSHPNPLNMCKTVSGRPIDPRTPSMMDMKTQANLNIPFGIVSTDGNIVSDLLIFPDLESPVLGMEYVYGAYDCFSIVRRYFHQEFGITIKDYARDYNGMFEDMSLYRKHLEESDFVEIPLWSEWKNGDLGVLRFKSSVENHCYIYHDGKFYHHINGRLSEELDFDTWKMKITLRLRYKDFIDE